MQTIEQLRTMIDAARNHIDVQEANHAEAVEDYAALVGTADDDPLEEAEAAVAHYAGLVSRAKARHAALVDQLADAEAKAKAEAGQAAKARADALLADVQQRINTAMQNAAAELVAAADACGKMLDECNEARRIANINGIQYWKPGEQINVPNRDAVADSVRRLGGLHLWRLY